MTCNLRLLRVHKKYLGGIKMFNEKFNEVLSHEGVVSIVSWSDEGGHVSNT